MINFIKNNLIEICALFISLAAFIYSFITHNDNKKITKKTTEKTLNKEFFEKRDQLSGQIGLLDKECFRLKSQMEKLEESREERISYMWEEYEITPNNALSYRKEELTDLPQMKKQVAQIKDEIRFAGDAVFESEGNEIDLDGMKPL